MTTVVALSSIVQVLFSILEIWPFWDKSHSLQCFATIPKKFCKIQFLFCHNSEESLEYQFSHPGKY